MGTRAALALACAVMAAAATQAWADRPPAGQGGIFVDEMAGMSFQWTDVGDDYLQLFTPSTTPNDFARVTPNGKWYVHVEDGEFDMFAVVGGRNYLGRGKFSASYFADCPVFDPAYPTFNCFIGPGPATMNASAAVHDTQTGQECTLSAHLAAFFLKENACEAIFGQGSCPGGSLVIANANQFDIKVTCPQ